MEEDIIITLILLLRGCDKIVPVDIYVPGCPPSAEALFMEFYNYKKKFEEKVIFKGKYAREFKKT